MKFNTKLYTKFRLAEMVGEIQVDKLEVDKELLSLWQEYFEVKDFNLLSKYEYYLAQIIQNQIASCVEESNVPPLCDILMTFDDRTELKMVSNELQKNKDIAFMNAIGLIGKETTNV